MIRIPLHTRVAALRASWLCQRGAWQLALLDGVGPVRDLRIPPCQRLFLTQGTQKPG